MSTPTTVPHHSAGFLSTSPKKLLIAGDWVAAGINEYAAANGIGFIHWAPISAGELAKPGGVLDDAAKKLGATTSQVALAWLLKRSPVMMPIPGTGSVAHLEENLGARDLVLDDATFDAIDAAAR